jgi:hypothetical protein
VKQFTKCKGKEEKRKVMEKRQYRYKMTKRGKRNKNQVKFWIFG